MLRRLLLVAITALALASPASAFSKQDGISTMSDGTQIATTLYLPDGPAPAAGWPAVILFHGLGGSRADVNAIAESAFVPQGYAALTFDERGHGASGGLFNLVGDPEISDTRALFDRLGGRADVDERRIGAFGISLGGGYVWRALRAGVPFAAAVPVIAWTDLYEALAPQNAPKSGVIGLFLTSLPQDRIQPSLLALGNSAIRAEGLPFLRGLFARRSTTPTLASVRTPVFMIQGRRDFAFDLAQAKSAFRLLTGPKRLYLGLGGHSPSSFPATDATHAFTEARQWFDRFLRGIPNGIDTRPPVELADEGKRTTRSFMTIPATRAVRIMPRIRPTTVRQDGRFRTTSTLGRVEVFGAPTVTVRATASGGWSRLVAVLSARTPGGETIVVSGGSVPTGAGTRAYAIRLIDQATVIPKGSRLTVTLASSSLAQDPANLLYLDLPMPAAARLTVRSVGLTLPVLR